MAGGEGEIVSEKWRYVYGNMEQRSLTRGPAFYNSVAELIQLTD